MALIVQGGIELDIDELNVPLNFSVADMKNPEKRRSSVSKTITLLGTSRTMRFLQVVYNLAATDVVNNTNNTFNFDPRTRIEAQYIEDGVVLFDGLLQVLKAIKKDGRYTFEAVLFSNTLNVVKELENVTVASLGWSEYDHELDKDTIRKAWDESVEVQGVPTNNFTNNIPDGFGYIYSWFDTGLPYQFNDNDPTNQKTNDMLVGVYFREILKKCMEYVGQDYEFTLNNTELFRRLVYFNEGGEPITLSNTEIANRFVEKQDFLDFNLSILPNSGGIGVFTYSFANVVSLSNFFLNVVTQNINQVQSNGTILINKTGNYEFSFDADLQILADHPAPSLFNPTLPNNKAFVRIRRNNQFLAQIEEIEILDVGTPNNVTINYSNNFFFEAGDVIDVRINYVCEFSINSFTASPLNFSINSQPTTIQTTKITALDTPLEDGDTVNVSRFLPEQSAAEWYKGFMRMFNLYQIDEGDKIKLIPAKDFYQGTNVSEDWTELIDYSEDFEIEPPNRIEGRYYNAKWSDENDYYNELYRNEIGQGYGNNVYDIGNVWQQGMVDLEVPFAQSVPVQIQGKADVYMPTNFKGTRQGGLIVEVEPLKGNKPRIFVYNGLKPIPQAQQNAIFPSDGTFPPLFITQGSNWVYPLFHHTLKPDSANPEFDVNFKYPDRVYFTPALNATTTANLWSVYWVTFINEITSADAKILTCYVKLSKLDIKNRDFSVLKNINGVLYRLNVVENYVTTNNVTTKCELIKVIEAESPQISVIPGTVIPLLPTIKGVGSVVINPINSDPIAVEVGQIWYRTDLNEIRIKTPDGISTINTTAIDEDA